MSQTDDQIDQTRERHACAGVGQHLGVGNGQVAVGVGQHGGHDGEAAQIREGRAKEGRDLALGDEVEQQGARPAQSRVVETLRPVSRGTRTVAPNMANICWMPRMSIRPPPSWRAS